MSKVQNLAVYAAACHVVKEAIDADSANYGALSISLSYFGRNVAAKSAQTAASTLRKQLERGKFSAAEIESAIVLANELLETLEWDGEPLVEIDIPEGKAGRGSMSDSDMIAKLKKSRTSGGKVLKMGSIGFEKFA